MSGFQEIVAALLMHASLITGLPIHIPVDVTVTLVEPCDIQAAMQPGEPCKTSGLRVVAMYAPLTNTVYLNKDWTGADLREQSTLLHELVHYLQDVNEVRAACPQLLEKQAYDAELAFLRLNGVAEPFAVLGLHKLHYRALTTCPPPY